MLAEMTRDAAPSADSARSAQRALREANAAHESGRLDEAEAAYLEALRANPYAAEAEHGLAWLLAQRGDWKGALPRFGRALKLRPWEKEFWISQLEALMQLGHHEAVHRLLYRASQAGLGADELQRFEGRLRERRFDALAKRVQASGRSAQQCSQAPMPEVMALRELFLKRRFGDAAAKADELIRRFPLCAFAWRVLGASQSAAGRPEASLEALRVAVDLDPDSVDVRMNLALALHELGRLDEAEASYRAILARQPANVRALVNIALLLNARGDPEAETMLREARRLGATDHRVALALGGYLRDRDLHDEALPLLEEALAADPDNHACISALSVCYLGVGRHEEAATLFRRLNANGTTHLGALGIVLFVGSHVAEIGADELYRLHRRYGELIEGGVTPHAFWENDRDPERRIRVGFVSGDLRRHAMSAFLLPLWEGLDRAGIEIFAYSNHRTQDETTARLRALTDGWFDIAGVGDEKVADRIRQDRIDVLVDLSGHTAFNRLGVFAYHPAPVQMSWGGYPATTGLARMDYYLADAACVDAGPLDSQFSESLLLLPASASFVPTDAAPDVVPLPSAAGLAFTFGSFNRMSKVTPATLALWADVLLASPGSELLIGAIDEPNRLRAIATFERAGIAPERIRFQPRVGMGDYLQSHGQVDLLLDTWPYAGGTTTCYGLWMGVPTLTLVGDTMPTRTGAVILSKLGLEAFVARDRDAFVRTAAHWAQAEQADALASIRQGMRQRLAASSLGSPGIANQGFEDAVRAAWRRWCEGQAPASFRVPRRPA